MTKCPICEKGELKKERIKEQMFGVYLGEFPAEICGECGESFTDSGTMKKIEIIAKKKDSLSDIAEADVEKSCYDFCKALGRFSPENTSVSSKLNFFFVYLETYGSNPRKRARLIATESSLWFAEGVPERLRDWIRA